MTKSELAQASFTTPKDVETKSYTLRVEGRIAYSLTTAYPNLMISFATDKTASNVRRGGGPVACAVVCFCDADDAVLRFYLMNSGASAFWSSLPALAP